MRVRGREVTGLEAEPRPSGCRPHPFSSDGPRLCPEPPAVPGFRGCVSLSGVDLRGRVCHPHPRLLVLSRLGPQSGGNVAERVLQTNYFPLSGVNSASCSQGGFGVLPFFAQTWQQTG